MPRFEYDSPFCSNPDCDLHVGAGASGVRGHGNWAELRSGRIVGRSTYCGLFLCDACLRDWRAIAIFWPDGGREDLRPSRN